MDWKMNDLCQLHHCSETYLTCLKTKFSCHCWVIAVKIGLFKWEITIGESSYDMTDMAQCWLITPLPPGPISVILKMLECAAVRCAFFPKCHHNPISSVWNISLIRLGCCSMVSCLQGKLRPTFSTRFISLSSWTEAKVHLRMWFALIWWCMYSNC